MLMMAVQRDGENRARLPLECHALARIIPDGGGAPTGQDQHHFLKQLPMGRRLAAGRDFQNIAIVGNAGGRRD